MWRNLTALKKLILIYSLKAARAVIQTVTGTAPLTLSNAIAAAIHSLTQYGLCTQDGTPTPDAPVDILCNNGAIKVSPNLANMVEANVVVGKYINNSGVETADIANFFYAPYVPVTPGGTYTMAMSSSIWYFSVMQYDSSQNFLRRSIWGATNTPVGTEKTFDVGADCAYIRFGSNMKKSAVSLADVLAVNWMLTQTATAQDYRPYGEVYIGGTHPKKNLYNPASAWLTHTPIGFGSGSASWPNSEPETYPNSITYFMRVKPNTTYTYSCATAGDRFGVAGENSVVDPSDYTTASKLTFDSILVSLKSSGVGKTYSFTTGANTQMIAVYCALNTAPTDIQIEEGATATTYEAYTEIPYLPETLTVGGQNLVDLSAVTDGYYYDQSGVYTAVSDARLTDFIPVKAGQKYTVYVKAQTGGTAANVRCNLFDVAKTWKSQSSFTVASGAETVNTITPTENGYLRVSANYKGTGAKVDWSTIQIVRGEYTLATMPPYEPYVAPQTVGWNNLFDASSYTEINAYVNANTGVLTTGSPGSMTQYCAVIPCEPNTQYIITGQGTSAWGAFPSDSIGTTATAFTKGGNLTTGANDRYLIGLVRANGDSIDYRNTLVVQETQTVPTLLSVGDYKDEGEIISGEVTRTVRVRVLYGTEVWSAQSSVSGVYLFYPSDMKPCDPPQIGLSTHFKGTSAATASMADMTVKNTTGSGGAAVLCVRYNAKTSVADFKAWLAEQYAAGTPVIVLYPLATETTEQATPQPLHTTAGTNVVEVSANVGPVELEVVFSQEA